MRRLLPLLLTIVPLAGCQQTPSQAPCRDFDCSGHGVCVLAQSGTAQVPTCVCDVGYGPTASGWLCLPQGETGLCAGLDCSSHGRCVSVAGEPQCHCDAGFELTTDGRDCDDPCAGVSCASHGSCQREGGPHCSCDAGYEPTIDGLSCRPSSSRQTTIYVLSYADYPDYQMGRITLTVDEQQGLWEERISFGLSFDWQGGGGVARKILQRWTLGAAGLEPKAVSWTDHYRQGNVTRLRAGSLTLGDGEVSATFQRAGKQSSVTRSYSGKQAPLVMLGAFEYPGWTFGCFSPAFYRQALQRVLKAGGTEVELSVYWPLSTTVEQVTAELDPSSTPSKPVLRFPDNRIKVIYDQNGMPESIVLESQQMAWSRYQGAAADLNMADMPPPTPHQVESPPAAGTTSSLAVTSADGTQLAGLLTLPKAGSGPFPAVLLLSGATARDGDSPMASLPQPLFAHLAQHLAAAGYASLRTDPRSTGASQGDAKTLTATQLLQDAEAAYRALRDQGQVAPNELFVLTHGTGSVQALNLAQPGHPGVEARGLILLGPLVHDVRGAVLYLRTAQLRASGFSNKFIKDQTDYILEDLDQIVAGSYEQPSLAGLPVTLWAELLAFDGLGALQQLHQPLLALRGDQDLDADPQQMATLRGLQSSLPAGHITALTLPGLTAMLTQGDASALLEDAVLPLQISSDAIHTITRWLEENR